MNRGEFLEHPEVGRFLDYFSLAMVGWTVEYHSQYRRIRPDGRHFTAVGVEQALNQYAWPARFEAPEDLEGYPFIAGRLYEDAYDWNSNRVALNYLRTGLQRSILGGTDDRALHWCQAILFWGLGANRWQRPHHNLWQIAQQEPLGLCGYLNRVRGLLALDNANTDDITAAAIPFASSGIAKIHSLASADGLVIFDSRVAAALGECINYYLREVAHVHAIPGILRIPRDAKANRTPTPVGLGADGNHPIFTRDYRWLEAQVRVSWLVQAALQRNPQVFSHDDPVSRAHMLEAALFMMGAQTGQDHHHFPALQV
jgi:hypothetical protein